MTPVLGHKREINQRSYALQGKLELWLLRSVWISKGGRKNGQNAFPKVTHFFSLPLSNLPVSPFWNKKVRVWWKFLPDIVESLLSFVLLEESLYPFHHVLEKAEIDTVQKVWLVKPRHIDMI
jgi:hypothetical protein